MFRTALLSSCLFVCLPCGAQVSLTPSSKTSVWQGGSLAIPTWSGGAFLTLDAPSSSPPNVYISGSQQTAALQLKLPGAVWMQNRGIARGTDGTIAICGQAKDSLGEFWAYLAFFGPNSSVPTVVRTDPYIPTGVTVAPDGTVWTKGLDWIKNTDGQFSYKKADHTGILRHFSKTGTLLGTAVPQAGFKLKEAVRGDQIASSADRVGWCQYQGVGAGPQTQDGSYFEVASDGTVSKIALPPFADGEIIDSLAITDNGEVFLSKSVHGDNAQLYVLDRATGSWQHVQFPARGFDGTGYFLLGSTGNTLAFWSRSDSGSSFAAQLITVE